MPDLDFKKITYKDTKYVVLTIDNVAVLVDNDDFNTIKKIKNKWKLNTSGFISCYHTFNNETKEINLHEVVMAIKYGDKSQSKPILHVNKNPLDNRKENLIYDIQSKKTTKNIKKKKRTTQLPDNCGIELSELPTYVWYMKPNGKHGERFFVDTGLHKWKTTSKKTLTLRYKLEEAKLYIRNLKISNPEYFEQLSMNGDLSKDGKELLQSYNEIINKAGFTSDIKITNNTPLLIKPGRHTKLEKQKLKEITESGRVRLHPTLQVEMPKYCTFVKESKSRGSYCKITNHPKLSKIWITPTSRKLSDQEKYDALLAKLAVIDQSN